MVMNAIMNDVTYVYCIMGTHDDLVGYNDVLMGVYTTHELADKRIKQLEEQYPDLEFYTETHVLNEEF